MVGEWIYFLLYRAEAASYLKMGYSFQGIVEYTTDRRESYSKFPSQWNARGEMRPRALWKDWPWKENRGKQDGYGYKQIWWEKVKVEVVPIWLLWFSLKSWSSAYLEREAGEGGDSWKFGERTRFEIVIIRGRMVLEWKVQEARGAVWSPLRLERRSDGATYLSYFVALTCKVWHLCRAEADNWVCFELECEENQEARKWRVLGNILETMGSGGRSMLDRKGQEQKRGLKKELGGSEQSVE